MFDDLKRDWHAIGRLGRVALIGVLGSALIAVALGFSITSSARRHLLNARTDLLETVANDLAEIGAIPPVVGSSDYVAFDEAVRLRLLGGETVRVKLWLADGTIAYSDESALVARVFELPAPAHTALAGEASAHISNLEDPAHALERDLGDLIEFFIPFASPGNAATAVFEIEQRTDSLDAAVGRIERNVWLSIGSGIAVLATFLALLFLARARDLDRRRREAEQLLAALFWAREEERRRIVGALHDDVGQPLYRLLYGLEGSRAKLGDDDPVSSELADLQSLVRRIDSTLRSELLTLHEGLAEDAGLDAALGHLAEVSRSETSLDVEVVVAPDVSIEAPARTALFRAAQEAVVNVRKHAHADRVEIRVTSDSGSALLTVADDGLGWRGSTGLGLATTRERLEALGGGLSIRRRRGGGTLFTAWVPIDGGATR